MEVFYYLLKDHGYGQDESALKVQFTSANILCFYFFGQGSLITNTILSDLVRHMITACSSLFSNTDLGMDRWTCSLCPPYRTGMPFSITIFQSLDVHVLFHSRVGSNCGTAVCLTKMRCALLVSKTAHLTSPEISP